MKVLQINIFGNLSTGKIAVDIARTLKENGDECVVAYARNTLPNDIKGIKIGNKLDVYIHGILTRITDKVGFYSKKATKKLIKEIEQYNPDIIHLHNLHGYYLNIEILFKYLKTCGKPVVWTLHDCWSYTGHCCYYSISGCNKWVEGCNKCKQKKEYPKSLFIDNSKKNYDKKKELFTSVPNLNLVAVSQWLADEVKKSFLKKCNLSIIYNGIDTNVFKPTTSDFRKKNKLEDKVIILGVASTWDKRKGLDDFIKLSSMLDEKYKIVVVGVNEKEKKRLTNNMIGISRTDSVEELAGLYSTVDIYFNASVEETFGLTTVEALACGTPVIVYNATALPEVVGDNGYIVEPHNLEEVCNIIKQYSYKTFDFNVEFDKKECFKKYLELYKECLKIKV